MDNGKNAKVCVIGAGLSGITAVKHLLHVGIKNITTYDKNNQVGGNWIYSPYPSHSSDYESSHIISSRELSQYHDFPMPTEYPDYPNHELLLKYFQDYAAHFGVNDYIQFNSEVESTVQTDDKKWQVTLKDGSSDIFDFLIVASGHHWNPRPRLPALSVTACSA